MNPKTKKIVGWILTGLIGLVFIVSAFFKLFGTGAEAEKAIAGMGLTMATVKIIGVVELICITLFIIPRTGLLGTLLMAAYLGGAIATHVEHQQPLMAPVLIECLLFITAAIRFPELSKRLMGQGVDV